MVELDHTFSTGKPTDYNWDAILDLDRIIPCVEGGKVIERESPERAQAEIKVKMGAMSMTFRGTVEVVERDGARRRAVLQIKPKYVEGGKVIERESPERAQAEIKVKMGAMSMTFRGTVE